MTLAEKEQRQVKALRLSMLGWKQKEIAESFGITQGRVSQDIKNCDSAKINILELAEKRIERHEIAKRFNLPPILVTQDNGIVDGVTAGKRINVKA